MNKAYQNMRSFWLDANNLKDKRELKGVGKDGILTAGLEHCMKDNNGNLKNIFLAASVLGNASLYFENNSPSGIGGMIGENNEIIKKASLNFINAAAEMTDKMMPVSALPEPKEPMKVSLFAIGEKQTFYIELEELAARNTQNPFYKFYAYSQQLIGAFRQSQEAASKK